MFSMNVTVQQTTVVSTTTIAPAKPPRLKGKKVLSEEQIREQMGAVGRAIEDHPNIYAGVTVVGVLSAFYGICANIVGTAEVNMALTRVLTNLTNYF